MSVHVAKSGNKKNNGGQNIKVFIRVRPLNDIEKNARAYRLVESGGDSDKYQSRKRKVTEVVVRERPHDKFTKSFHFDEVFGENSKQIDIYRSVAKPLVDEVLKGYNCTIFAYGQTGTGKTYTMEGNDSTNIKSPMDEATHAGIIPRCVAHLFDELRIQQLEFNMTVSFLELYNEELYDLLSGHEGMLPKLQLYKDVSRPGSCIVKDLAEISVRSKDDVYEIIRKGSDKRQKACTLLNAQSSRSHTVFTVTVIIKESTPEGLDEVKIGKLHLVDLAGSENIGRSGAVEMRAAEAGKINQSLLTLGRVITSLVEDAPYTPYRDSKLTRLLQDALGGRTKTSIIATVSPASVNKEESLSTLDYAHRAKNIKNRPEVNKKVNKQEYITDLTKEIDKLKRDLLATYKREGVVCLDPDNYDDMVNKMEQQNREISEQINQIRAMEEEQEKMKEIFSDLNIQLDKTKEILLNTESDLKDKEEILRSTQKLLHITANERDEQSHLVEAHQKTENKLANQAYQLIAVADQTSNDVDKLHDKIDRKKNVECYNEQILERFTDNLCEKFSGIRHSNSVSAEKNSASLNNISLGLNNIINDTNTFTENTIESMNEFSQLQLCELADLSKAAKVDKENQIEILNKYHTIEEKGVEQMKVCEKNYTDFMNRLEVIETAQVTIQKMANNLKTEIKGKLSHIQESWSLASEELMQKIHNLETENENMKKMRQKHWEARKEQSEKVYEQDKKHSENLQNVLSMVKCILEDHEKTRSERQQKADSMYKNEDEEFSNEERMIDDNIVEMKTLPPKHTEKLQSISEDCFNTWNSLSDQVSCEASTISSSCSTLATTAKLELESNVDCYNEIGCKTNEFSKNFRASLCDSVNQNVNKFKIMEANINKSISTHNSKIKDFNNTTRSKLETQITEVKNQSEEYSEYNIDLKHSLDDCGNLVNDLFEQHLQKDIPTGLTPVRQDYKFPRNVAETSPHQKLIERFRRRRQLSTKIPVPNSNVEDQEIEEIGTVTDLNGHDTILNGHEINVSDTSFE